MGMRIGGSGAAWASQNTSVGNWQQRQQNMKALGTALQGSDLGAAQTAFAAISTNNPNMASNPNSPLAKIGQALQAGDLAGAQQAQQAWRGAHHPGEPGPSTAATPNAATSSFLQTLTPVATTPAASDPAGATTSATSTSAQVEQALAAFEKNLFDSLRAQDSAPGTASSASPAAAASTGPTDGSNPAAATPTASASGSAPAVGGRQHHHHQESADTAKLGAELGSLISQTASGSANAASSTATPSNLDQSFNNLLSTLGVSGNNASLNTFLQALQSNMRGGGASTPVTPAAAPATA